MLAFNSKPIPVKVEIGRLGAQRVGLAVEFLA